MPGTLLHLAFAEEVYQETFSKHELWFINKFPFMCGNLIPDEAADKHLSHYRTPYKTSGFFVPALEVAQKDLIAHKNSLSLGMYCHLYLDYHFITNFIIPEFIWNYEKMQVTNPNNNKTWKTNDFLSKTGFYSAYSELNQLLIEDGKIDMSTIDKLPANLPKTKIPVFDTRRLKTWKEELTEFLSQEIEYTGDIFDYDKVIIFLEKTAKQFVEELKNNLLKN